MKKIYINEEFMSNVVKGRLLPQFLFKLVKTHTTSLRDNEAFPTSDEYPFDYILLKERYNEVCDAIDDIGLESLDEDYLMSELSSLVTKCKELETPVRDALEKVCENALNKLFAIPEESINMTFKLVDRIKFKSPIRMRPESSDSLKYNFKDIADIDLSNKAIGKRRFIDALIQGASYIYANVEGLYIDDIDRINSELPRLYRKIRIINDFLLFTKKEEMSDDKPMQGSYVETHLGIDDAKTTIKAQGIIFPLLFHEAIKGLFELFSAHGLPQDREKAQYIIRKADFVLAEPWDLRLGVGLWRMIFGGVEDTNMIPYMFTSFVKIPTDEFNLSVKEILSNTEKGNEIINALMTDAEYDNGYQQFTNRINARNVDKSLIQDSYFTGAETSGFEIDSEGDDGVIEEDDVDEPTYPSLGIKNDGIETWYRGICGTFDELKTKRQIWLADEAEYAALYAYECENGHLYEFDIDATRLNLYDWYYETDSYFDPIDGFSEEEQMELMEEGYNGYSFALDDATVLVLFDKSLITNIREIPLNNYINENNNIEVGSNSEIEGILANATVDNIDFVEGDVSDYEEKVFLSIDGTEISREFVQLDFRPIYKRFPTGKHQLLNIDIILAPQLRGMGLGTKVYAKAVREFGAICSRHSTRHNDNGIKGIFEKLKSFNDIAVFQDTYNNFENETICDYYAILKSELPKYMDNEE